MATQSTQSLSEERNPIYIECMAVLIALLKKKFIQSLAFGCYLAKPKDKDKFIDELSLAGIIFIQCIHGLFNEDYAFGGMTAEILQTNRKLYKELKLYSTDFEFWVHQNFKFARYQVITALTNCKKIRASGLFLTPKSVFKILSGFVDPVRLRPRIREILYNANKTQEEAKEEDENETDFEGNVIAITSAEVKNVENKKKVTKILFVKKEKGPNIKNIEESENWMFLKLKYQELLKPKVLGALEFACTSSIYGKEFTLKYLENPMKRLYFLWLYGLVNRDHILFSLACNCLAFAVNDKNPFPPDGFNKWITTNFIFPRNKLFAGARFLKKLNSLEFLFILPELEQTFVNLSFIETNPAEKLNLKDVVEGKWEKPKRINKKVVEDQTTEVNPQISEGCSKTNCIQLGPADVLSYSEQPYAQQPCLWTGPDTNEGYYQQVESTIYTEGNGFASSIPYRVEESNFNCNSISYQTEAIGFQTLQTVPQTWNISEVPQMGTHENICNLSSGLPLSNTETALTPLLRGTDLPIQSQTLQSSSQIIPDPPPPPILSKVASPKSSCVTPKESDSNVDSILNWLEEKNKVIQEALIKSVKAGRLEDLTKLVAVDEADHLKKTRDLSTGETLLHIAAREDHESLVEFLIEHGGCNTKDHHGRTPLHTAVLHGRATIVEILLESQADSSIKDNDGKTPYELAIALGKKRLADKIVFMNPYQEEIYQQILSTYILQASASWAKP